MLLFGGVALAVLFPALLVGDDSHSVTVQPQQPLPTSDCSIDDSANTSLVLREIFGPSDDRSCNAACQDMNGLKGYCVVTNTFQCHNERSHFGNTTAPEIDSNAEDDVKSESYSFSSSTYSRYSDEPFVICVCECRSDQNGKQQCETFQFLSNEQQWDPYLESKRQEALERIRKQKRDRELRKQERLERQRKQKEEREFRRQEKLERQRQQKEEKEFRRQEKLERKRKEKEEREFRKMEREMEREERKRNKKLGSQGK